MLKTWFPVIGSRFVLIHSFIHSLSIYIKRDKQRHIVVCVHRFECYLDSRKLLYTSLKSISLSFIDFNNWLVDLFVIYKFTSFKLGQKFTRILSGHDY